MEEKKKKKGIRKKMDKLLLGVIVGGAVGSILGLTLAPKSGKETRKEIAEKTGETWDKISNVVGEIAEDKCKQQKDKGGFWHFLNKIFCKKK